MNNIKDKHENVNDQPQDEREQIQNKSKNVDQKKTPAKGDSDTEPDEFIGPNADTDQPLDGQVINDAVLRGEPHSGDNFNEPSKKDTNNKGGLFKPGDFVR